MGDRKLDLTATGFVFHKEKLLFIFHSKLQRWLTPGGHIDPNESPDATARREVLEEVGLNVQVLDAGELDLAGQEGVVEQTPVPFYTNIHSVGDHDHWGACYLCESDTSEVKINSESKAHIWLSKEEILNHSQIMPEMKKIASHAFEVRERLLHQNH